MYRWWTVFGWWWNADRGVKLGPVTLYVFVVERRWHWGISLFNRWYHDSLIAEWSKSPTSYSVTKSHDVP